MDERGAVNLWPRVVDYELFRAELDRRVDEKLDQWWLGIAVDPDKVDPPPAEPLTLDDLRQLIEQAPPHECTGLCYYLVEPHLRVNHDAGAVFGWTVHG